MLVWLQIESVAACGAGVVADRYGVAIDGGAERTRVCRSNGRERERQRSVCIVQMAERGANGSTEVHRSPVCVVRMAERGANGSTEARVYHSNGRERGQRIDRGAPFARVCWFESLAVVGARALESLAINQGPLQLQHRSESRTVLHLCFNGGVRYAL